MIDKLKSKKLCSQCCLPTRFLHFFIHRTCVIWVSNILERHTRTHIVRTQTKSYSLVTQKEHQRPRCQTKPIRKETLVKCKNTLISCCTGETVKHTTVHRTSITCIHKTSLGKIHGCTRNCCDLCCVCVLNSFGDEVGPRIQQQRTKPAFRAHTACVVTLFLSQL